MDNKIKLNAFLKCITTFLFLGAAMITAGCANTYVQRDAVGEEGEKDTLEPPVDVVVTETPPIIAQPEIAEHAAQVHQSLEELYAVERAKKPENLVVKATPMLGPTHSTLRQPLSIDWSGPAEPLLAQIAMRTHYRLKIMGVAPAIPLLVTITAHQVPAQEVLQNIRSQIYERGDILLFPEQRVIELHYID